MRHLPFLCLLLAAALPAGAAGDTAADATALRDLLRGTAAVPTLAAIRPESGCSPSACFVDIGQLRLRRGPHGAAGWTRADGRRIRVVEHRRAGTAAWPAMDPAPLGAYAVRVGERRWGSCIEFASTGIGKSGVHQRWTHVVLVPDRGGRPGALAHRFLGYWSGCDALQATAAAGELALPVVERAAAGAPRPLEIAVYRCGAQGCRRGADARRVEGDPAGATGALTIPAPEVRPRTG